MREGERGLVPGEHLIDGEDVGHHRAAIPG
jgi:hypothetical protein